MRTVGIVPLVIAVLTSRLFPAAAPHDEHDEHDEHPARSRLDVVVRDQHGRIARDLSPSDFKLTQNGVAVPVTGVKLVDGSQQGQNLITLLFGPIQNDVAAAIRSAAGEVIAATRKSNIRVAVYQVDQSLTLLQAFTTDQNALKSAIGAATGRRRSGAVAGTVAPAAIADQTVLTAAKVMSETGARPPVAALIGMAREQEKIPGRKAVVYFSEGIPVANAQEPAFLHMVSAANRGSVSIYAVDADALAISDREQNERAYSAALLNMGGQRGPGGQIDTTAAVDVLPEGQRPKARDRSSPVLRALSQQTGGFSLASAGTLRNDLKRIREDLASFCRKTHK